jgi:tetratricopeptide (TPR) repeat protein
VLEAGEGESELDLVLAGAVRALGRSPFLPGDDPRDQARRLLALPAPRLLLPGLSALSAVPLARALIEEARISFATDSGRAVRAAELALVVLRGLPEERELRLAAHLHHANALRSRGDLDQAGRIVDRHAEELTGLSSRALRGDLHGLAGAVRQDQGRPQDAMLHFLLAQSDSVALGDDARTARALLRIASLLRAGADLTQAIATAAEAVRHAARTDDSSVYLCARHNLAAYLIDAGLYEDARESLAQILRLYPATSDSLALLRYRWLSARLAAGAGDHAAATAIYLDVRDRLLAQGHGRDAALITVDLAYLHLRSQDVAACRHALASLCPILRDHPPARRTSEVHELLSLVEGRSLLSPPVLEELASLLRVSEP